MTEATQSPGGHGRSADAGLIVWSPMSRTINVSNRLPVRVHADGTVTRTTGGLASALDGAGLGDKLLWIGWPGVPSEAYDDLGPIQASLERLNIKPVFLSERDIDGFYEGYANSTLWPLVHYMLERAKFDPAWWQAYRRVNEAFARAIVQAAGPDDIVWIHDYHLVLLPQMLREERPDLRIGFFLHTPFPSSDVFRALPERSQVLRGLLGADIIGFHTVNYVRHFRSALLRVLGLAAEMETLHYNERTVHLRAYPIGHNHVGLTAEMEKPDFPDVVRAQREQATGTRIILSVERLDYTKGLPEKLAAIRRFLERNSELSPDVSFVLIAVPSRQGVEEYDALTEEVQREVGAINGDFGALGHTPVLFFHRSFSLQDLAALYVLAEVCMVTPLRDGMNLVAKEFLDCQDDRWGGPPGILILSEFAGAAEELSQALIVNPFNVDQVADSLVRALAMTADERRERIAVMQKRLRQQHAGVWAGRVLDDITNHPTRHTVSAVDINPLAAEIAQRHQQGDSVGIFLDYDGTLRDFVNDPKDAVPDPALPGLLRSMQAIERVDVAVVSGRPPAFLEQHLGGLGVTLVGEHGYRWLDRGQGEWVLLNPHVDTDWKDGIRELLERASMLTPGTHVEEKQSAVVWHYRRAEPEHGLWRARALLDELTTLAANLPVTVHHGQKIVEVSSLLVSKGAAVDFLMNRWQTNINIATGDDQTDEAMFALEPTDRQLYTIKVGPGSTKAKHRTNIAGLRAFLNAILDNLSA